MEIDEMLMFDLMDVEDIIEDHDMRSYAIAMTLAAAGKRISESLLAMYLSKSTTDEEILLFHLAAFGGMNLLEIKCDCFDGKEGCYSDKVLNHHAYIMGRGYFDICSAEYMEAFSRVETMRLDFLDI